ncbi:MAG TPA: ATP-binding cassette domain-containing protein [Gaiellaceae bacterium]|nr:ATP-binding cassette domain-containing protein [Gaiellaceae bacterium]
MAAAPIRTEQLRKVYGTLVAVDGLDLEVRSGEFFGLLGPNGAGKSTTIGMLTTTVVPTKGRALVSGLDVRREPARVKREIGVVSQANTLDRALTVWENLYYHGRFFGVPRARARARADELLEQFALTDRAGSMVFQLSGGLAQRLMIARALVHEPHVLFLDEPTSGIDPQTRINLWRILEELHRAGQTTLLTTHYMEEADVLCQRIAIIDHGKALAVDTPAALKREHGDETLITVTVEGDTARLAERAERLDGIRSVEQEGQVVRVHVRRSEGILSQLIAGAGELGLTVRDATSLPPSLETVFLNLTGREYRE